MSPLNKPTDVFKHIDMVNGPEWTDPDTQEVSRCWPFTGKLNTEGRPYIQINGKKYLVYRLVFELVTGEILGTRMYRHKCDNGWCCNPKHGIPGEHQENMEDMKQRERHGLPHHVVVAIRKLIDSGIDDDTIAKLYGKGRSTIYDIRVGNTYGHVKDK